MHRREASINDVRITQAGRRVFGPRPADQHGTLPIHLTADSGGKSAMQGMLISR